MHVYNTIIKAAATIISVFGVIVLMFAAGSCDAGADTAYIVRMMAAGFVAFAGGMVLARWPKC